MHGLNVRSRIPGFLFCLFFLLVFLPVRAAAHAQGADFSPPKANAKPAGATTDLPSAPEPYAAPSQELRFGNYLYQALGPFTFVRVGFVAGVNQATHTPPEWREGFGGYGHRYASDFSISLVNATTRYALAEATGEDTIYYRCSCTNFWARLGHAVVYTGIARRGEDGHKVFSVANVVSPYIGPTAAVYGWYPSRYGARDAFRMGNYDLLGYVGRNIGLEFLPTLSRRYPWIAHLHIDDQQAESEPAPAGQ